MIKINKKYILKLSSIILLFFIFSSNLFISYSLTDTPSVYAPSCILMEANTGKILYSKNANEQMYPASTTKVMTAILTLENCNLSDIATVSHDAIFSVPHGYSIANLQEGEELTIQQLLYTLLVPSANDSAFVLAEHIAGSVDNFSKMMNDKAQSIGCKNTNFVNPNGIHNENHYSTAYDLALIGQYAMKFNIFKQIVFTTTYSLPITNKYDKDDRLFNTTNELISKKYLTSYYYEYANGAKTGYTDAAKSCIIATAKKDDIELIVVILHDEKTEDGFSCRPIDCKSLFEYGFNNYSFNKILSKGDIIKNITVSKATNDSKSLNLSAETDIIAITKSNSNTSLSEPNISLNDNISAPISKGDILGTVTYSIDGSDYSTNLIATNDVSVYNFSKTLLKLLLAIVLLILFTIFIKNNKNKNKKKRKNSKKKKCSKKRKNPYLYNLDFYPNYK